MNWSCVEIGVIKKSDFFEVGIYVEVFIDSKLQDTKQEIVWRCGFSWLSLWLQS